MGKLTLLRELTLYLYRCEGLLDVDPLSSLEHCVNLEKLNLNLEYVKKAGSYKGLIRALRA